MKPVFIYESSILSCAGSGTAEVNRAARKPARQTFQEEQGFFWGRLDEETDFRLKKLQKSSKFCSRLDRACLLAIACAEDILASTVGQSINRQSLALVVGSARGAQASIEDFYRQYIENNKPFFLSSPLTSPGIMSSATAQKLGLGGGTSYQSSACITSLQALFMAALQVNDMSQSPSSSAAAQGVLVIAAESCLSPYYQSQLRELGVLAKLSPSSQEKSTAKPYVHCAFHPDRTGMVLAEGAGALLLGPKDAFSAKALAKIIGFGFSGESASLTGISSDGLALQSAIRSACQQAEISVDAIDLVVAHGSGTKQGDAAELAAYTEVFNGSIPFLTSHKWLIGHTLGAATLMSAVLAVQMLISNEIAPIPYLPQTIPPPNKPQYILLAALGFGGQAGAMILERMT